MDVTGNINVTGTIKANGVDGTANQVLAKDASNNLAWTNTAFINNVRFSGRFEDNASTSSSTATLDLPTTSNPAIVSTTANSFIVNKTGLYHFDFDVKFLISTNPNPTVRPFTNLSISINGNKPLTVGSFIPTTFADNSTWELRGSKSLELHISAPATITISNFLSNFIGNKNLSCHVFGHLISD